MITTELIQKYFETLEEFERFRLNWIRVCTRINEACVNAGRSEAAEHRAQKLVEVNCPYLRVGERMVNFTVDQEETGQMKFA